KNGQGGGGVWMTTPDQLTAGTDCLKPASGLWQPSTVAAAYDRAGGLWVQTREPAMLVGPLGGSVQGDLPLDERSRTDDGMELFHSDPGAGIACASCHPEAGEDGRVWQFKSTMGMFSQGPRRTQALRGGLLATAPFHWDGAEHDFGALVDDVLSHR